MNDRIQKRIDKYKPKPTYKFDSSNQILIILNPNQLIDPQRSKQRLTIPRQTDRFNKF